MPSEEINLDPNAPSPRSSATDDQAADFNNMDAAVGDLSNCIVPGMSNEAVLDQILEAADETLIPWEECHLPSSGIYYGWPDGVVMVRPMGQMAEKVLATQRLAQSGQSMDLLFQECVKFPIGFDSGDLLLGDRVFLLYYLRGITHGNMYEFAITCPSPNCGDGGGSVSTHTYDLNELARTVTWANPANGVEPFKVQLPYLSKVTGRDVSVGVRFLRGVDASDILARKKARKKMLAKPGGVKTRGVKTRGVTDTRHQAQNNQSLDESVTENLNKMIVDVMGVTDHFKIRAFVEKMHAQDTAAVREWLRNNTPGIDNTVTVTCPECELEFTVELPITESFFRPSKQ